ncbi:glycosyltransferase [Kitasatospora sp. NPDC059577]|uniref:glycosyltransferase n=1 Tax=Kitasatospora sp. NPDC059577 TaxID=3346873 RepID=UPI0036AFF873
MRILLMTAGSHGDVAPYTGLGARLRGEGHHVALAAPEAFRELVAGSGLEFRPLPADPRGTSAPAGSRGGRSELLTRAAEFIDRLGDGLADAAAPGADVLLLSVTTAPLGWHLAEAMDLPCLGVYLQPTLPTREFPPVVGGGRSLGSWGNRAAGALGQQVVDRLHTAAARRLRSRLGLPAVSQGARRRAVERAGWPVLHGFSRALVPRPEDWREGLRVVGNWWPYVAADYRLPAEVEDFLRAGPPPVFIGFGSMAEGQGARLGALAVEALRQAGLRGVLQAGWAGTVGEGSDVLSIGEVSHAHLFPRLAAVVHHAGAGTAAAALRAGVPSVPVPVMADQPFWADRLARIGAATAPLRFADLTAARLAEAVRQAVEDRSLRTRARAAARAMAEEDGAARVAEAVAALGGGR